MIFVDTNVIIDAAWPLNPRNAACRYILDRDDVWIPEPCIDEAKQRLVKLVQESSGFVNSTMPDIISALSRNARKSIEASLFVPWKRVISEQTLRDGKAVDLLIKENRIQKVTPDALVWQTRFLAMTSRGRELGTGFDTSRTNRPLLGFNDALIAGIVIAYSCINDIAILLSRDRDFNDILHVLEKGNVQLKQDPFTFAKSYGWTP